MLTRPSVQLARARTNLMQSEQYVVREAALNILGAHGKPRFGGFVESKGTRATAFWSLGRRVIGHQEDETLRVELSEQVARFAEVMLSDDYHAQSTAVRVLGEVGDEQSIALLEAFRREQRVARLRDSATKSIADIRERGGEPMELAPNEVEDRMQALEERLKALEDKSQSWERRQ